MGSKTIVSLSIMRSPKRSKTDSLRYGVCLWRIDTGKPSSIAFYASSLIREWSNMWPGRFVLFYPHSSADFFQRIEGSERFVGRSLTTLDEIYKYRNDIDILYTPYWWSEIGIDGLPQVHFIPDLVFLVFGTEDPVSIRQMMLKSAYSLGSSPLIIAPSQYTRQTIAERLDFSEEHVRVVYHGTHPIFSDESATGTRPANLVEDLNGYLFYPAISATRKNHLGLLDALVLLRERYGFEPHCVLAGPLLTGFDTIDVPREIKRRGLSKTVRHLGSISLSELKYLYVHAKALVFPSRFEGFGIPVLEAMKVGCPVIASNQTSIPEFAGEAALYFDPYVVPDIAETILRFYQDPSLAPHVVAKGREQATRFSDQRQARETKAFLDEAYWKSIDDTSRRRAIVRRRDAPHPLLSVIVRFRRSWAKTVDHALDALVAELGQAIEVIWIVSDQDVRAEKKVSLLSRKVTENTGFPSTFRDALASAEGRFVFLSRGDAIPLASFVCHLAEMVSLGGPDAEADIIHGDGFLRQNTEAGTLAGRTIHTIRSDYVAEYCRQSLAFVIRREALSQVAGQEGLAMRTFGDIAAKAFETCSRKRLYIPVSEKVLNVRPLENPYSDIHIERVQKEYRYGSVPFRLLNHRHVRQLVLRLLDRLLASPLTLRNIVSTIVRTCMIKPQCRNQENYPFTGSAQTSKEDGPSGPVPQQ